MRNLVKNQTQQNGEQVDQSLVVVLAKYGIDSLTSLHTSGLEHECFSGRESHRDDIHSSTVFIRQANKVNIEAKKHLNRFYLSRMFGEYSVPYRAIFVNKKGSEQKVVFIQKLISHINYKPGVVNSSTAWLELGRVMKKIHATSSLSLSDKKVDEMYINPNLAKEKFSEGIKSVNFFSRIMLKVLKSKIEKGLSRLKKYGEEKCIVHGDLKPENAIYNEDGSLYKIIDYDKSGICHHAYDLGSILVLRGKKCLSKFLEGYEEDRDNRNVLYKKAIDFSYLFGVIDLFENLKNGNTSKATNSALRLVKIVILEIISPNLGNEVDDKQLYYSEFLRCKGEEFWKKFIK